MPKKQLQPNEKTFSDTPSQKVPNQPLFDKITENEPQYIIKFLTYTAVCKPLNSTVQNNTYLFTGMPFPMKYETIKNGKKVEKVEFLRVNLIKPSSIKGILNHGSMKVCLHAGIEACHSTDKLRDKEGNWLLHQGFHPKGWCDPKIQKSLMKTGTKDQKAERKKLLDSFSNVKKRCILHQVYGSKNYQSLFSVYVKPFIKAGEVKATATNRTLIEQRFQQLHRATDHRVVMTYEGIPAQNFNEDYFSGYFTTEVNVTQLSDVQLGFLLNSIKILNKLGRGYNTGYGRVFVDEIQLVKQVYSCDERWNGHKVTFLRAIQENPQPQLMQKGLVAWRRYREKYAQTRINHS